METKEREVREFINPFSKEHLSRSFCRLALACELERALNRLAADQEKS